MRHRQDQNLPGKGRLPYRDIAILFRTNTQPRKLVEELISEWILPHAGRIAESLRSLDRKDILLTCTWRGI
ncbi:MAG: hypothetical protein V8Q27_09435 [Eubacteriales bacterium]